MACMPVSRLHADLVVGRRRGPVEGAGGDRGEVGTPVAGGVLAQRQGRTSSSRSSVRRRAVVLILPIHASIAEQIAYFRAAMARMACLRAGDGFHQGGPYCGIGTFRLNRRQDALFRLRGWV
jgi:hypothetical protein